MRNAEKALIVAVLLAGCERAGDGPSRTEMDIVEGKFQQDTVTQVAPQAVRARVYRTEGGGIAFRLIPELQAQGTVPVGSPVVGVNVCYEVVTQGGGRPTIPCNTTNAAGEVATRWELGTRAGMHAMEAKTVDASGEIIYFDSAFAEVFPGAARNVYLNAFIFPATVGQPFPLDTAFSRASDAYFNHVGNPVMRYEAITPGVHIAPDTTFTPDSAGVYQFLVRADSGQAEFTVQVP